MTPQDVPGAPTGVSGVPGVQGGRSWLAPASDGGAGVNRVHGDIGPGGEDVHHCRRVDL